MKISLNWISFTNKSPTETVPDYLFTQREIKRGCWYNLRAPPNLTKHYFKVGYHSLPLNNLTMLPMAPRYHPNFLLFIIHLLAMAPRYYPNFLLWTTQLLSMAPRYHQTIGSKLPCWSQFWVWGHDTIIINGSEILSDYRLRVTVPISVLGSRLWQFLTQQQLWVTIRLSAR